MAIDVGRLSQPELERLIVAAGKRKKLLLKRRPISVVRAEIIAAAAGYGYTMEELFGIALSRRDNSKAPKRSRRTKVAAKYRDPQNKRNTWSGRGRMPLWLAQEIKRGRHVADFLIPGLARPTEKTAMIGRRTVIKNQEGSSSFAPAP